MRDYRRPGPLRDVLAEYAEEAGWLYERRCRSFTDPALSWLDLADYDARMLRHLDGLALGGWAAAELLHDVLREAAKEPRNGFPAAAALPRLPFVEPIRWVADALIAESDAHPAIVAGLELCASETVSEWLRAFLDWGDPALARVAAIVVGYRRERALAERIADLRSHADARVALAATWAISELGQLPEVRALEPFLRLEAPEDLARAIDLYLLADPVRGLERCRALCGGESAASLAVLWPRLAIAGTLDDADRIAAGVEAHPEVAREGLVALGQSGSLRQVGVLLAKLDPVSDWEVHGAAVHALRFLSTRDELPTFDRDEVAPAEITAYASRWRDWWEEEGSSLDGSRRWRRGQPISARVLWGDVCRPGNPARHLSQLEARLHFGSPVTVQFDALFATQQGQVERLRQWAEAVPEDR